ncbi:MAG: lipocalin family protein [Flavobacteriaceae bacterium]
MHLRKLVFTLLLATGFVTSCSISKAARQDRSVLSGNWILNSVSYEGGQGKFRSVLFNDSDASCFEGSTWFFRNNNSTGSYILGNGANCDGAERFIRWSVLERPGMTSQLQFKFIDDKYKDISGGLGYRLDIEQLNEQLLRMTSKVAVEGQPLTVVYEFIKNDLP